MSYDNWKGRSDRDDSPDPYEGYYEDKNLLGEINRMEREISAYREALEECLDWFKERADGEILIGGPMGNAEMHFSTMIEETLKRTFK